MAAKTDWESIERVYRAGSLSIRSIADKHGISDTAIRKRATKHGWQRDLTEKVRESTREKLVRSQVREPSSQQTEDEIIEEASSEAANIVLQHRAGLADWRAIAEKLCCALSGMDVTEDNHDKFARSLNAGVDAQLKVIKGERQAYNLDTEEGDKDTHSISDLMDALSSEA
jgi:hypothetical protein